MPDIRPAAFRTQPIFVPSGSAQTIYRWGLGEHNRETLEGRIELAAYIANNIAAPTWPTRRTAPTPSCGATTRWASESPAK